MKMLVEPREHPQQEVIEHFLPMMERTISFHRRGWITVDMGFWMKPIKPPFVVTIGGEKYGLNYIWDDYAVCV